MPFNKFFNKDTLVKDVDWSNWDEVVSGLERRYEHWYFSVFEKLGPHDAFVVLHGLVALIHELSWLVNVAAEDFLVAVGESFKEEPSGYVSGLETYADAFLLAVTPSVDPSGCSPGPSLPSWAEICGTGKCVIEQDGILIFDPWVLEKRLRAWVCGYYAELREYPQGMQAKTLRERLGSHYRIKVEG